MFLVILPVIVFTVLLILGIAPAGVMWMNFLVMHGTGRLSLADVLHLLRLQRPPRMRLHRVFPLIE